MGLIMKKLFTVLACLPLAGVLASAKAEPLSVAFCPAKNVRTYPLSSTQHVDGLVLENAAIVNRGADAVTLTRVDFQLLNGGAVMEERHYVGDALTKLAAAGPAVQGSGMMKEAAFQFCGTQMVGPEIKLAGPALATNQAMLVMHQTFAYRGARDVLRVHVEGQAAGKAVSINGDLPIVSGFAKNSYIFPLRGAWYAGVGPTWHGGHRWAVPEQFAFDIAKIGDTGKSYHGTGTKFTDYYAYGAEVIAAAAGKVVAAEDGLAEDTTAMRRPDETPDAYLRRLIGEQSQRMAGGPHSIAGNYVLIDHGNGEYSMSAHLKPGSVRVKAGDTVAQGQAIGQLGSSGNSTEPHLHFQICDAPDALMCAGIPVQFSNVELPWADGTREIQSGDIVVTK
jgi:murein DD-endopeptidase MepM/ murein hydrolase activator NlpD